MKKALLLLTAVVLLGAGCTGVDPDANSSAPVLQDTIPITTINLDADRDRIDPEVDMQTSVEINVDGDGSAVITEVE